MNDRQLRLKPNYPQSQCLLLFPVNKAGNRGKIHLLQSLHAKARRTRSVFAAASVPKAAAFLSQIFCKNRPDIVALFERNNVHIIRNGDELTILDKNYVWYALEVIFDDRPKANVNSVRMTLTGDNDWFEEKHALRRIFPSMQPGNSRTRIKIQYRRPSWTSARVKPAVDEQNCHAFKGLLNAKFGVNGTLMNFDIFSFALLRSQVVLTQVALDQGGEVFKHYLSQPYVLRIAAGAVVDPVSLVKLLLDRGANVNAIYEEDGTIPLHWACQRGPEIVEVFLRAGADISAKCNVKGRGVLHFAAKDKGWETPAIISVLVDSGAAVNATDKNGRTPLHYSKSVRVTTALLKNGADPNITDSSHRTALYRAIQDSFLGRSNLARVKILLDFGASVDLKYEGLGILETVLFKMETDHVCPAVFTYLLARCFVDHLPLTEAQIIEIFTSKSVDIFPDILSIFGHHLARINCLKHQECNESMIQCIWPNRYDYLHFKRNCELEVAQMQSHMIFGSDLSIYEVLMMDEYRVARLLRNRSVKIDVKKLHELFPSYGEILECHFKKGRNQLSFQKGAIKSCESLSLNFKSMPDEVKMNIVGRLSPAEIMILKRACAETAAL